MGRPTVGLLLSLAFALALATGLHAQALDPELAKGIKLVDEGDYDGAILTLDNAARRLATDPSKANDLSQAYVYLGIAYVGKGHEAAAKAKFREALAKFKGLSLSPDKYPPKVIDLFEAARQESAAVAPAPAAKKGGGGKKTALILGGVAVAGGGAALALGGGGGGDDGPADNRRTEAFTGTLCVDGSCDQYRCYDIVVSAAGTLEETATWTDSSMIFTMNLMDGDWNDVARSNRVSNTSATLTASVRPQTSCPTCSYHTCIDRQDDRPGPGNYTLTIKHP